MGGLDWWKRDGYETKGEHGVQGTEVVWMLRTLVKKFNLQLRIR